MDRAAELTPGDEITVWMALCHDLGKCRTPSPELPSHHGHEERGYPLALRLGKRLALPNRLVEAGREAAWLHMKGRRYGELRPGTRVDLLIRLHAKRILSNLFTLVLADTGLDFRARAAEDLSTILQVKLEEADRNKGKESGEKLRMLRCQALSA